MTVLEVINKTTDYLRERGVEGPRLNAELLIAHLLKMDRIGLYLNYGRPMEEGELKTLRELVKRRARREPLQYITGRQWFWSAEFKVNADVLIPRPETEILVEEAIKIVLRGQGSGVGGQKPKKTRDQQPKTGENWPLTPDSRPLILDLCTGSGCIAITLAKELPNSKVYAVDSSEAALQVARENVEAHGVEDRITFLKGDLYQPLVGQEGGFALIISNPPYIRSGDIKRLQPEIKDYEPLLALDGGEDGLEVIRRIIRESPPYLEKGGWLILEVGMGQAKEVVALIEETGVYNSPSIINDYSGIKRVVKAQRLAT